MSGRYLIAHQGEVVAAVKSVAGLRDVVDMALAGTLDDPAIISMAYPVRGQKWLAERAGRDAQLELEIRDQTSGQVFRLLVRGLADPLRSGLTYEATVDQAEQR